MEQRINIGHSDQQRTSHEWLIANGFTGMDDYTYGDFAYDLSNSTLIYQHKIMAEDVIWQEQLKSLMFAIDGTIV